MLIVHIGRIFCSKERLIVCLPMYLTNVLRNYIIFFFTKELSGEKNESGRKFDLSFIQRVTHPRKPQPRDGKVFTPSKTHAVG